MRTPTTAIWMDCGHGTFLELQRHVRPEALDAIVISHQHADHCVDLTNIHILLHYDLGIGGLPVVAPAGVHATLGALFKADDGTFDWDIVRNGDDRALGDLTFRFSRTHHTVETLGMEIEDAQGARLVYTADTGADWSPSVFGRPADLVLSEATFTHDRKDWDQHLSALEAGTIARAAGARALMLTHRAPVMDARQWEAEGTAAFGAPVLVATSGESVVVAEE